MLIILFQLLWETKKTSYAFPYTSYEADPKLQSENEFSISRNNAVRLKSSQGLE